MALVIGQKIGTATSSAVAAIGASSTAKRLAVAYIAFKPDRRSDCTHSFSFCHSADCPAVAICGFGDPAGRLSHGVQCGGRGDFAPADGPVHTNDRAPCARARIGVHEMPRSRLTVRSHGRGGGPAPARSACSKAMLVGTVGLENTVQGGTARVIFDDATVRQASDALQQASVFLSKVTGLPPSHEGHQWFTSTLHALDHAGRLTEAVDEIAKTTLATGGPEEMRAAKLCATSMRGAAAIAAHLAGSVGLPSHAADDERASGTTVDQAISLENSTGDAIKRLKRCSEQLADLRVTTAVQRSTQSRPERSPRPPRSRASTRLAFSIGLHVTHGVLPRILRAPSPRAQIQWLAQIHWLAQHLRAKPRPGIPCPGQRSCSGSGAA